MISEDGCGLSFPDICLIVRETERERERERENKNLNQENRLGPFGERQLNLAGLFYVGPTISSSVFYPKAGLSLQT